MIEFELSQARIPLKMEERLPRASSLSPLSLASTARGCAGGSSAKSSRNARFAAEHEEAGDSGSLMRCTGRQCRSCTGVVIADCVALCCCPCALLNFLALAFVRIPYLVGKRWCLKFRRRKKGRGSAAGGGGGDSDAGGNSSGGVDSWFEVGLEEQVFGRMSEKFEGETEKVWVDLYEFDHLSFGRVSFTGIPLQMQSKGS